MFLTPVALSWSRVEQVALGMVAFSALASAGYILNDLLDRDGDRAHPVKRARPLAAGSVSVAAAVALLAALLLAGLALAWALTAGFFAAAATYAATSTAYSLVLKNMAIIDVAAIAFGFLLRIQGGAELIETAPSAWIMILSGQLALFLALAKRRHDLRLGLGRSHRKSLAGYNRRFLDTTVAILLGSLLISYLIYTTDAAVTARIGSDRLYYTAPFVAIGVLRYLQITLVEDRPGWPLSRILADPMLAGAVLGWILSLGFFLYAA